MSSLNGGDFLHAELKSWELLLQVATQSNNERAATCYLRHLFILQSQNWEWSDFGFVVTDAKLTGNI
jgi:hypothetical protein